MNGTNSLIVLKPTTSTNRLTVIHRIGPRGVLCRCSCGIEKIIDISNLRRTGSCGCLRVDSLKKRRTHGKSSVAEYAVWLGMMRRCYNQSSPDFRHYGGRGISVDISWHNFVKFYSDMGQRPFKAATLERIDNNGAYCKENCKWATRREQSNNIRRNVRLTFNGKCMTVAEWAFELKLPISTLQYRHKHGWSSEKMLSPVKWCNQFKKIERLDR